MTSVKPRIMATGISFTPRALNTPGFIAEDINDPGEIGTVGRYRDQPLPRGNVSYLLSKTPVDWDAIDALALKLPALARDLKALGAEEITLHLDVIHDGQCNFDISPILLKAVTAANVVFTISCWSEDVL